MNLAKIMSESIGRILFASISHLRLKSANQRPCDDHVTCPCVSLIVKQLLHSTVTFILYIILSETCYICALQKCDPASRDGIVGSRLKIHNFCCINMTNENTSFTTLCGEAVHATVTLLEMRHLVAFLRLAR